MPEESSTATPLTTEEIEAVRARLAARTKGKWVREMYEDGDEGEGPFGVYPGGPGPWVEGKDIVIYLEDGTVNHIADVSHAADAALLVAAPIDMDRLIATIDALNRSCDNFSRLLDVANEERAEVRKIVEARENESTPDAVHRARKDLFSAYSKKMDDVGRVAIEQIEGALHDGAIGMRDACLILVRAAGQGQPRYIAAAMDALRRSIETLLA